MTVARTGKAANSTVCCSVYIYELWLKPQP